MIIAVARDGHYVSQHFGHCEEFALFDTDRASWRIVANPGHQPGFLPQFLKEQGADVIIAGGMGARAQELCAAQGIQVIVGASGPVDKAAEAFIRGDLLSTGDVCSEHQHAHDCHGEGGHHRD